MPLVLEARQADVAGLPVGRVLPQRARRSLGPFVFLDEMGPASLPAGRGIDVPPHPHIGLSTLTYLLSGEMVHRDSLGCTQSIRPGEVNWMTAGAGVVHSERSDEPSRARDKEMHGVQAWVALPPELESCAPSFDHQARPDLPAAEWEGVSLTVLVGEAFGRRSPVKTTQPLFYVDALWSRDATLPLPSELGERGAFVLAGRIECGGVAAEAHQLLVMDDADDEPLRATAGTRALLLGGPAREAELHMHWNYVASDAALIESAKARWAAGEFPAVVDDDGSPARDPRP